MDSRKMVFKIARVSRLWLESLEAEHVSDLGERVRRAFESLGPLRSSGEAPGTWKWLVEWVIVTYDPGDELNGDSDEVLHSMAVFCEARELAVWDLELDVAV